MRLLRLFLFLTAFICLGIRTEAQVVAGFTASPTSGCAPLLVNFTNTTTPSAGTTYSWAFGGSSSSVLTNPSTSFTVPGTHVVTLTATNGSSVSTYTMAITVYPPPTVSFTATDTTVCPGTAITFTNTSVSGVPGGMTCTWNWGDGSPVTGGSPAAHTYGLPGNYTVSLFVTNAQGCQASLVKTAYVQVYNPPVASFTSPGGACNPPASITFTSTSTGAPPISTTWTFGTGPTTATGSPVTHTFGTTGSFPVTLVVADGNGCMDTFVSNVNIATLAAQFSAPDTACVYQNIIFTNTSTTPFTGTTWNYGDGSPTESTTHGSHAYSAPGTYNVSLTITNGPCSNTIVHPIVIVPGPSVSISVSPPDPCPAPATVTYSGVGPAGLLYNWTFTPPGSGGGTGMGSPITITYPTNGVKSLSVVVTDPNTGCTDTVSGGITIYDIIFNAIATPFEGCVPLTVNFYTTLETSIPGPGYAPYPYGPLSGFVWNFGDGSPTSSSPTPSHTYTAEGIYTATVTAVTANGCPVTDVVQIRVGRPPQVSYSATPRHICFSRSIPVVFQPTVVVGPVDRYDWVFGDGTGTTVLDTSWTPGSVPHIYVLPGVFFTPTVTPYYRGCPGVPFSITDYIRIDSPMSRIDFAYTCNPKNKVSFTNNSLGDDSHLWIFPGGVTSTVNDPDYYFPTYGTHTVALTTHNVASGCRDTAIVSIYIDSLVPSFVADRTAICRGESVTFTASVSGGAATAYRWFDNGIEFGLPGPASASETRTFTTTGYHTVRLLVRNVRGCWDTVTYNNYILVSAPNVGFTVSPASGCAPLAVTFTSTSTPATGSTLASYTWRYGDGINGTGTPSVHTYTAAGTYSVWLIVSDNLGCRDSLRQVAAVTVWKPVASFNCTNVHPCIGSPTTFTSTSTGTIASYVWTFGDGSPTGSGSTTSHAYSTTGTFNVRLQITDTHGCTDEVTYPAYITVTKPNAGFNMSDSVSVCPPLFVNFTNTSSGGVTGYDWSFGDGGTSVIPSPSNMYLASGLYPVRQIVTDMWGCRDTAMRSVNIFGYAGAMSYTPLQGCAPLTVYFTATLTNIPFITWDFSDGFTSSVSFSDTISHTYVTPGAYVPKLLLSDNTGCQTSSVGIDTIKVDALWAKFDTDPSPVCVGMPFTFIDSSEGYWNPPGTWLWTFDGNTSNVQSPPPYTINTPGSYPVTLTVTSAWGCTATLTKDLVIEPPPVVTASGDTIVCVGDPATLYGYGAATYTWAPPATLSCTACNPTNATPTVETVYTVTGTDSRGCTDTATVTVGLRTHTISHAWGDTAVCFGIPVPLFDTGGHTYLWLPTTGLNDNTVSNPIATPPYTTIYTAIARLGSCIPDTNYVTVVVWPLPTIDAGPDQRLVAGSAAQLNATGTNVAKLEWWPNESLSCKDCFNPVATMTVNTTYYANVESDKGCKASDSVRIFLYCENSQIFVPNAFTPNNDGENDVFYPRGVGIKEVKTFRIYNRWGELLFERNNISLNDATNAWDGSYKGADPKPDVYVYIIEALCYTDEDIFIKGDVTIIR